MKISHLTPTFADIKTWVRSAAVSVNQLITGKQDASDNLTSLAGLDLTGHSGDAVVVLATEDGFELSAVSGGSGIADGDYGDITASGSGTVLTIDNDAVTYAKIQNVSATDKLLGRSTAGAGDIEEIACTAAGRALLDDANAAAQLATLGAAASGAVTSSGLTMAAARLLGRTTASTGAVEEISVSGLTLSGGVLSSSGRLIGVQIFTSGSGTYMPTSGTNSVVVEQQGAGGGGGGVAAASASQRCIGRGGGGGGYLRKRLTANFSGASYSVGAKGTGGAAGNNAGSAGGDTTFTDTAGSPTTYTAGGGPGGLGAGSFAGGGISGGVTSGGTVTNGDVRIPGGASSIAFATDSANVWGGSGGASYYSRGGGGAASTGTSSNAGTGAGGYGGGGGGASAASTGTSRAGGDGSDGIIIIWEYS